MESIRKWFYKPKRDDHSLLARFFFADETLNVVAAELDSFDGRKDPERCSTLVNQLRLAQDHVLRITSQIMDQLLGEERVARGFRVKFPEDVLHQDNLAGQLWFGAECLAAGSSIMNREEESAAMRPLARALTRSLETVRGLLRDRCLRPHASLHDDMLIESLKIFDRLFAEFELCYVSAMVTVKTPQEFESQQLICVLFSETLNRALKTGLLTQDQVDDYDPALMFAIPRLAIVTGLLVFSHGPLSIDKPTDHMSEMFRPFRRLLYKIRELLWTLDRTELLTLERLLCTNEDISNISLTGSEKQKDKSDVCAPVGGEYAERVLSLHPHALAHTNSTPSSETASTIEESDYLPSNVEVITPIIDGFRRLEMIEENGSPQSPVEPESRTFQENSTEQRSRRTSRNESSDLSSLRNLSTNGLMMFDPLVINAATNESPNNVLIPDSNIVESLNDQVTEIADKLSTMAAENIESHSHIACDVSNLISTDVEFGSGNDLLTLPSTSHGFLIPNAISQEPVVLASLSQNNSAIFDEEFNRNQISSSILDSTNQLIVPEQPNNNLMTSSLTIANENLSSILSEDLAERVKFVVGYESDTQDESQLDSGVGTENTSLDRSPESEENTKKYDKHYMNQNRVLDNVKEGIKNERSSLESSFTGDDNVNIDNENTTVDINYKDDSSNIRNEAGLISDENSEAWIESAVNAHTSREEVASESVSGGEVISENVSVRKRKRKNGPRIWSPGRVILEYRTRPDVREPMKLNLDHLVDGGTNNIPPESNIGELTNECASDEQIALALQAQEIAARDQARSKFRSSEDLIHRLFVCIAGVADQLQTNFASDLRNILKSVFLMNQTPEKPPTPEPKEEEIDNNIEYEPSDEQVIQNGSSFDSVYMAEEVYADSSDNSDSSYHDAAAAQTTTDVTVNDISNHQTANIDQRVAITDSPSPQNSCHTEDVLATALRRNQTHRRNHSTHERPRPDLVQADDSPREQFPSAFGGAETERVDLGARCEISASTGDLRSVNEQERVNGRPMTEAVEATAPAWIPDMAAPNCMRCDAHFTAFRRRHHCRNCGKVFCAACSNATLPLPHYGQFKPVRVCLDCYETLLTTRPWPRANH